MINLKPGQHVHMMGICGTAMASLAGLLKDRGFKVTGSDANPYPPMSTQIENLGIPLMKGYRGENLQPQPDFVIVGNVISRNNPEAQEMVRLEIPHTSLPKAMGELIIADRESIVIAGTHGKTTTTSMMSWIAESAGLQPGFLIGGIPKNFSQSFKNSNGKYFIIEGDEYDTAYFDKVPKFVHYRPRHVILTSLEFDHADIYKDLDHVKEAFRSLMKLIPSNGTFLWCKEEKNIEDVQSLCNIKNKFSYGLNSGDYQAHDIFVSEKGTEFSVIFCGQVLGRFKMTMSGNYNVLNATADIALAHQLGWNLEVVKKGLESFEGVKRRQEILGEPGGVLVIEDFAHHPTAVRETLKGLRSKYPQRKMFAVFEPRSATSRRKIFQKDYVEAFSGGAEVLLARAFDAEKIQEEERFSSEELTHDLKDLGVNAACFSSADEIVKELSHRAHSGDMIVVMSNGGFDGIYKKLLNSLETLPRENSIES